MSELPIMDIETQCEAMQCFISANFLVKKVKTKHGLISYCSIWINTEKQNMTLASLRHI